MPGKGARARGCQVTRHGWDILPGSVTSQLLVCKASRVRKKIWGMGPPHPLAQNSQDCSKGL